LWQKKKDGTKIMKTLKECKSIEEKRWYIQDADPLELAGEITEMEAIIVGQKKWIESLREDIRQRMIADDKRDYYSEGVFGHY